MKLKSLLLGSVTAAGAFGLAAGAHAADLGVVTSLDVCDALGLSGLTISSDDNCLVITGEVTYQFDWGDYNEYQGGTNEGGEVLTPFARSGNTFSIAAPGNGTNDWDSITIAWLQATATADSDFGPASATIKLEMNENVTDQLGTDHDNNGSNGVYLDKAYVSVGDSTVLTAGIASSIADMDDDSPLNYLGLFGSGEVNTGVGFSHSGGVGTGFAHPNYLATGGASIQVVSDLGNGVSIGAALEDLNNTNTTAGPTPDGTAVGVIKYKGDNITAHATFLVGDVLSGGFDEWGVHAGVSGSFDAVKFVAAIAADDTGWWNGLASASATFDMFTLAASVEGDSENEFGFGVSASAAVSDGVTVNAGFRWFEAYTGDDLWQATAQLKAAVTETVTLVGEVGYYDSQYANDQVFYGAAEADWAPGGGFTSSIRGEVNSNGGTKATFKAGKAFQ